MADYRYNLRGEIDVATAPQLRAALGEIIDGSDAHVLIDCTALSFIDSTGIAAIVEAHKLLQAQGRHMLVVNVQRGPRRVFEMLGLTDLLGIDRSMSISAHAAPHLGTGGALGTWVAVPAIKRTAPAPQTSTHRSNDPRLDDAPSVVPEGIDR